VFRLQEQIRALVHYKFITFNRLVHCDMLSASFAGRQSQFEHTFHLQVRLPGALSQPALAMHCSVHQGLSTRQQTLSSVMAFWCCSCDRKGREPTFTAAAGSDAHSAIHLPLDSWHTLHPLVSSWHVYEPRFVFQTWACWSCSGSHCKATGLLLCSCRAQTLPDPLLRAVSHCDARSEAC
jgi:hypothetical protein